MKQSDFLTTLGLLKSPYTNRQIEIKNGIVEVTDLDGKYITRGTPKEVEGFLASEHPTFLKAGTGVVSPAYSAADTVSYKYGASHDIGAAIMTAAEYDWATFDGDIGDVDGCHFGVFMHWDVKPGPKVITGFTVRGAYLQSTHIYSYAVDVWEKGTGTYTLVATTGAIAADAGSATSITLAKTLATPLAVTLAADKTYYVGFRVIRKQTNVGYPYLCVRSTVYTCVQKNFTFSAIPAYFNGTVGSVISTTNVAAEHNVISTYETNIVGINIVYTSTNYIEQELVAADFTNKSCLLAVPATAPSAIKFEGLVVGDGKSCTITLRDLKANGLEQSLEAIEFDCGNSVAGQNDMICAGNTVNLPDIGGNGQEGRTFDLLVGLRPQVDTHLKYDLYWQDRFLETAWHSHAVANAGTRGTLYEYSTNTARPQIVTFTGAGGGYNSMTKIQVGTRPLVIVGDSQAISGQGAALRSPNTSRWGALPAAMTKPRMWILHGGAGCYLGTDSTGVEPAIFKHATPGQGDGCELLGLGCDWWLAGMGINDLNACVAAAVVAGQQATGVLRAVSLNAEAIASIAEIVHAANERLLLTGLPPFSYNTSGYGANAKYYAQAVRAHNRMLLGLAIAWRCPFYNPWPDMVLAGTETADVPTFRDIYTDDDGQADLGDDGQHYSAAGGAVVVPKMVAAIESGTIDFRDMFS